MADQETMPAVLVQLADEAADAPMVLEKRYGKWTSRTRGDILGAVTELAHGLVDLGLRAGDTGIVMLASHASWLIADLALQSIGVRVAAIGEHAPVDVVSHVLADSGAQVVFVQDQAGADRVLAAIAEHGRGPLAHLVYIDAAGVAEYTDEILTPYAGLRERGRELVSAGLQPLLAERRPADVAVLSYSHGVAGAPRAALLTHRALVAGARSTAQALAFVPDDRVMSVRPLSDPVERGATLYPAVAAGSLVVLPENAATVGQAAWETAPTSTHLTLRHMKTVASQIRVRMQSARGLKGLVTRTWYRRFRRAVENDSVTPPSGLWRALVAVPVLEKLGLNRARQVVVSGDRVPREAVLFFRALGLRLTPAYALSQIGGLVTLDVSSEGHDVGTALPGVEVRIDDDGEILVRGESVATAAHGGPPPVIDDDGWLHTGDIGSLGSDGRLVVSHRRGEQLPLADGGEISCSEVESELRASPYVTDAVIESSEGRVLLVLELMASTVERWAARRGIQFTTFRSLSQMPEVRELMDRVLAEVAERHPGLVVDDLVLLGVGLDTLPGLLTATGKARRAATLAHGRERLAATASSVPSLPEGGAPAR